VTGAFTVRAALALTSPADAVLRGQGVDDVTLAAALARGPQDRAALLGALRALPRRAGEARLLADGDVPEALRDAAVTGRLAGGEAPEASSAGVDSSNILPQGSRRVSTSRRSASRADSEDSDEPPPARRARKAKPKKRAPPPEPEAESEEEEEELWGCPGCGDALDSFEALQEHAIGCDAMQE